MKKAAWALALLVSIIGVYFIIESLRWRLSDNQIIVNTLLVVIASSVAAYTLATAVEKIVEK
jgi:hypothetical protein